MELTIIVLFIAFFVSYAISRSIFHPSFIVSGLWLILLLLYAVCNHPLWALSDKFFKAILLWVIPFSILSLSIGQIKFRLNNSLGENAYVNIGLYKRLYPLVIAYSVIFILSIIYYAGGVSFLSIRQFMVNEHFPMILKLLFYLNTFVIIYAIYGLLHIEYFSKKKVVLLFVLLILMSIIKSNKTSFLSLFVAILYVLYQKGKLKLSYILWLVIALVGLLVLVTINRSDYDFAASNALSNFMYIYLLSPLTAFDIFLNGEVVLNQGTYGSGTFTFVYKIINALGGDLELAERGQWVNVPLPTNVFTVMIGYYLNNGYFGIFSGSIVLGTIWGVLYRLQKKGYMIYIIFYASMISSLFFQSFGDYFFYSFSMTLQYYIFSILVSRGVRFGRLCRK